MKKKNMNRKQDALLHGLNRSLYLMFHTNNEYTYLRAKRIHFALWGKVYRMSVKYNASLPMQWHKRIMAEGRMD